MRNMYVGDTEYFKGIGQIPFEGPKSDNPLAFKFYQSDKVVGGKTMEEHLRFSVAYWHSFCADGTDPFGNATMVFPWSDSDPMKNAMNKADAAFEFMSKLGTPFYAFHDADVAPEGSSTSEYVDNYLKVAAKLKELQDATGIKLLWNTSNLFSNPRYMNGGITNPEFSVLSRAALQIKTSLDVNVMLGGSGYTFWGGREGYMSLWNTDMGREIDHLGSVLTLARDYGRKIGFNGSFYIEPKPMEPSKHQYDYDAATTIGFIRKYGLENDFSCNIENNHATLAGHSFAHDLTVCASEGLLGSVDANQGDIQNGWDTDEFPTNVYDAAEAMSVILKYGGFKDGGLNFDAKRRRNSTDLEDLFISHIGGMDTFALGLTIAQKMIDDGKLDAMKASRYSSFDSGDGKAFEEGKFNLEDLASLGMKSVDTKTSGKQELINNMINQYIFA